MPSSSSEPLLQQSSPSASTHLRNLKFVYKTCRSSIHAFLSSKYQHYVVLSLVSFDLLGIFADIIINLYQCDEKDTDPKWDDIRNGLDIAGLVFSCLFILELLLSVWAYGWRLVYVHFISLLLLFFSSILIYTLPFSTSSFKYQVSCQVSCIVTVSYFYAIWI
jgi:hypothetical protein